MPSCPAFGYMTRSEKNILFHQVPSKKRKKELYMKWRQSIKQIANLPSDE